ncbi:exported hypothetical protein [Agrobacterium deltaense Zutra 3/1]|uniref:Secreted protein n=1 Tax=Agrobacterium deltaense Zutra 3/1 TaxID=1183427 RepID=A0A1S7PY48_9HYPH|nr:hypothetical protein [Agrobacterium deltaense]CUX28427.1 exported hypothetical protein [Agrobacterium deltaense Zutra 3/1]
MNDASKLVCLLGLTMTFASPNLAAADPGHGELTVLVTAENGALTLQYHEPGEGLEGDPSTQCAVGDKITLPAGGVVNLQFISADVPYSFEIAGYVEKLDIVPGLVSYSEIVTPAEAGQVSAVLQTHAEGSKKVVAVRFRSDLNAFDSRMFCAP